MERAPVEPPLDYFFAGAASLAEQLDNFVLLVLRDGRHLLGRLISYDHFGTIVLADAAERHFSNGLVHDIPMGGLYLCRGENLALLAQLEKGADDANPLLRRSEWEEVRECELRDEEAHAAAMEAVTAARALVAPQDVRHVRIASPPSTAPPLARAAWAMNE